MFISEKSDEKLKLAFDLYNKELYDSFPADAELDKITFSERFVKKMEKLLALQKKSYYYMINTVAKRVAIILLAIIVSLTATTFGVKAIREAVIKFITETFEKYTTVRVENDEPGDFVFEKLAPLYIPEGFTIFDELDLGKSYQITYMDGNNNSIDYDQSIGEGVVYNADTEGVVVETVYINSFEGICYKKNGFNTVIFADQNYVYNIIGVAPMEEIIKMAESINLQNN